MLSTLSLVTLIARERDDLFVYINLKFQLQNLWPDNTKEPNKQLPYVHTSPRSRFQMKISILILQGADSN